MNRATRKRGDDRLTRGEEKWQIDVSDGGEEGSRRAVIAPPIIPLHFS